jgi:hypothetical protein
LLRIIIICSKVSKKIDIFQESKGWESKRNLTFTFLCDSSLLLVFVFVFFFFLIRICQQWTAEDACEVHVNKGLGPTQD